MKQEHTPGPWKWNGGTTGSNFKIECSGGHVIDAVSYEGSWLARYNLDEDVANARLMAASPDLLRALLAVRDNLRGGVDLTDGGADVNHWERLMDDAIAKATGKETP